LANNDLGFNGAGLGLRRGLLGELLQLDDGKLDFIELAPENWIGVGGSYGHQLRSVAERFPVVCHGLSLSIGGPAPLDLGLVESIRLFLKEHNVQYYTEHLSYCSDVLGNLYELMPIPFTEEAVSYVANRIMQVQDLLGERIAVENVSYYAAPGQEINELDFVNNVIRESDCDLLLDVNNIYVNSVNFGYDPYEFISGIDTECVKYMHIAGHYKESEELLVDSHGSGVADSVWDLLSFAYERFGVQPTLLERDFNFPTIETLISEVDRIKRAQN